MVVVCKENRQKTYTFKPRRTVANLAVGPCVINQLPNLNSTLMANSATYTGITPDLYNQLRDKLGAAGIELAGNSGRVSKQGVTADYAYEEASQTLQINNVQVSFPASMMFSPDKIIQKINEAVRGAGGQVA
ncbi:hypothetical protein EFA69_04475 [Rufibacter immobilis]|uniref:Uncharacterized protein n=2 Tax=Rufibacter immobilis TaxID=1348778 RepID=A0A3M9N6E6_9BACT|nr:hypothetical protein EFA69_04475 [Rufibacter immobilis]